MKTSVETVDIGIESMNTRDYLPSLKDERGWNENVKTEENGSSEPPDQIPCDHQFVACNEIDGEGNHSSLFTVFVQ